MSQEQEIYWLIQEKYHGEVTPQTQKDIEKLKKGYPLAYLIGNQPFLNTTIDLSQHPLIPRVETEYWVNNLIQSLKKRHFPSIRGLDIFAGSGCIGIALLKNLPFITMDFAEKNKKFLKQIKINLQLNKISPSRYRIIASDVFQSLSDRYNLIVANPPYVSLSHKNLVQKEVIKFEPHSAVFAPDKGMFFIKKFINQLSSHLLLGGQAYLEFDSPQKEAITQLIKKQNQFQAHFFKDQYQQWRYVVIEYSTTESR